MNVRVNGEPRELPEGRSVGALLVELGLRPEQVAVELNRKLLRRVERDEVLLRDGDEIEMVTLVGGG